MSHGIKFTFATVEEALQFASQSELTAIADGECVYVEIQEELPTMQQLLQQLAAVTV